MRLTFRMVLLLTCFAFIATPPVIAKDVGKSKTEIKAKSYAITLATPCENAVFVKVFTNTGKGQVAATKEVANLKTATVKLKANVAVVASRQMDQRVSKRYCLKLLAFYNYRNLHVDPGLRNC